MSQNSLRAPIFTFLPALFMLVLTALPVQADDLSSPWRNPDYALVLDAYGKNRLDLEKIQTDPRVAAIMHKATQGLKAKDRKYASRRNMAKMLGFKWGSYHLLTRQNTTVQIDNYLAAAGTHADETYAIDVECLSGASACQDKQYRVSIDQVKSALRYFKQKTGHFPLLYANGYVTYQLSKAFAGDPEFAGVPLWYARFRRDISPFIPNAHWQSYRLWQFASEVNCQPAPEPCPYRVPGTRPDMDVNVYAGDVATLRTDWPIDGQ